MSNIIYFNDVLTGPATYLRFKSDYDPYGSSNVADDYKYDGNKINVQYNTSNELFSQFLMEKVFKLVGSGDGTPLYKSFSESYTPDKEGNANGTTYVTPKDGHLAGTILAFQCEIPADTGENAILDKSKFNVAIVIEETYNADGDLTSKVDFEMRESEPLAQSVIDTTGTVYIFKKGVKLSDVGEIALEKKKDAPTGYVEYNGIAPTNMSKGIEESSNPSNSSGILIPDDGKYSEKTTKPSNAITTYFTGYIVIGGFYKDPEGQDTDGQDPDGQDPVDKIVDCKPYITILRVEKSASITTNYTALIGSEIMFESININENSGTIKTQIKNVPSHSVFESVFTVKFSGVNGKQCKGSMNYYVLNSMIKTNQ